MPLGAIFQKGTQNTSKKLQILVFPVSLLDVILAFVAPKIPLFFRMPFFHVFFILFRGKTRFMPLARGQLEVSHPLPGIVPRRPTHGSAAACFLKKQNKWFCRPLPVSSARSAHGGGKRPKPPPGCRAPRNCTHAMNPIKLRAPR